MTRIGCQRHLPLLLVSMQRGRRECGIDWEDTLYVVYHSDLHFKNTICHPHYSLKKVFPFLFPQGEYEEDHSCQPMPKLFTVSKANKDTIANLWVVSCRARWCPMSKSVWLTQSHPDYRLRAMLSSCSTVCAFWDSCADSMKSSKDTFQSVSDYFSYKHILHT